MPTQRVTLLASAGLMALVPAAASGQSTGPSASAPGSQSQIVVNGNRRQYDSSIDRRTYAVAKDLQGANGTIADVLRNIPSVAAFLAAGFRFAAEIELPEKRAALLIRDRTLRHLL